MRALPELKERLARANLSSYTTASGTKRTSQRYGTAVTDGLFMSSRDGQVFHRWGEAFIRPGLRYTDNLGLRRQLPELGADRDQV